MFNGWFFIFIRNTVRPVVKILHLMDLAALSCAIGGTIVSSANMAGTAGSDSNDFGDSFKDFEL